MSRISKVVERVKESKAMRHTRDEFYNSIEEILYDSEFIKVFEKELDIKDLTEDEIMEIVIRLSNY